MNGTAPSLMQAAPTPVLDKRFWNGVRWDGTAALSGVEFVHVFCYLHERGRATCDIRAVGCSDGRWFVEDYWGKDARGAAGVWSPLSVSDALPAFFSTREAAVRHAVDVVADISGCSKEELLARHLKD